LFIKIQIKILKAKKNLERSLKINITCTFKAFSKSRKIIIKGRNTIPVRFGTDVSAAF